MAQTTLTGSADKGMANSACKAVMFWKAPARALWSTLLQIRSSGTAKVDVIGCKFLPD